MQGGGGHGGIYKTSFFQHYSICPSQAKPDIMKFTMWGWKLCNNVQKDNSQFGGLKCLERVIINKKEDLLSGFT